MVNKYMTKSVYLVAAQTTHHSRYYEIYHTCCEIPHLACMQAGCSSLTALCFPE